jgi:hypothetical protein
VIVEATDHRNCVRTVSHTPRNPGQTPSFTGTRRCILMLREVVDRKCVGAIWCASARARGINFQACSIDHSDISPFRIKHLRTARNSVTQNPPSIPSVLPSGLESAAYKTHINS